MKTWQKKKLVHFCIFIYFYMSATYEYSCYESRVAFLTQNSYNELELHFATYSFIFKALLIGPK